MNTPERIKAQVDAAVRALASASDAFRGAIERNDAAAAGRESDRGSEALTTLLRIREAMDKEPPWVAPDFNAAQVGILLKDLAEAEQRRHLGLHEAAGAIDDGYRQLPVEVATNEVLNLVGHPLDVFTS